MSSGTFEPTAAGTSNLPAKVNRGWLVGPWFDLLLVANVAWPLVLLAQFDEGFAGREGLRFWQVYFVTTPHRWITLALVFFDRQRFGQRKIAFLSVAVAVIAICLGVRISTGTLTCLLTIDYIWNAWHFAAQHHGIFRIYERLSDPQRTTGVTFEKWAMRLFLLYVILRVASATWSEPAWERWFSIGDWIAMVIPIWLVATNLWRSLTFALCSEANAAGLASFLDVSACLTGRMIYLVSVMGLYLTLLWAVHVHRPGLVLALATVSALFHAIEYLALVSWSVQRRPGSGRQHADLLGYLAPRWIVAMGVFLLILGTSGWLLDQHLLRPWLTINVIVAFLHYAYDGMIWKYRPKAQSPSVQSHGTS